MSGNTFRKVDGRPKGQPQPKIIMRTQTMEGKVKEILKRALRERTKRANSRELGWLTQQNCQNIIVQDDRKVCTVSTGAPSTQADWVNRRDRSRVQTH
jgi:hypothetical protein